MFKNKKNKYFFFLAFLILLLSANIALALEIKYPRVPGLPDINQNSPDINAFIGYFFGLGIYIAGILALISFTVGAIGLIVSVDNAEATSNAKDRMKGAILGLILTVTSFIIIKTINPTLVKPVLTPLSGTAGVFYYNESTKQEKAASDKEPNVANRPKGFDSLFYDCSGNSSKGTGPALLIWEFPKPDLEPGNGDLSGVKVVKKQCGDKENISSLGSFKTAFETPGVYFCLGGCAGGMCSGYMSGAINIMQNNIGAPFAGKIKGVKFVNDQNTSYGAIFHQATALSKGGGCTLPITTQGGLCQNVPNPAFTFSADIFNINTPNPVSSGDGVSFFSETFGPDRGVTAGVYQVKNTSINPIFSTQSANMRFDYTNITKQPDSYKNTYVTFPDRPKSIDIKGSYVVALYSGNSNAPYCQSFRGNAVVPNLDAQPIVASGGTKITNVYIIAARR